MKKVIVFLSVLLLSVVAEANPLFVKGVNYLSYNDDNEGIAYYDIETRGLCIEINGTVKNFFGKELGYYTTQTNGSSQERTFFNKRGKYLGKSSFSMDNNRVFRIKYYNAGGVLVGSFSYKLTSGDIVAAAISGLPPIILNSDY